MPLTPEQKRLVRSTEQLEKISELPTELALRQAASFLTHLVKDPDFLESLILPLLEEARSTREWYVAHRHEGEDGAYSLQVFVWHAGTRTKIHTTPLGEPTAAPSGPCSKSATSAWTIARAPITPA